MNSRRAGRIGGPIDVFFGRVGFAEADVLANAARKQRGLLHDDADLPSQRGQVDVPDVVAVDEHVTGADVVETRNQIGDGRLARTRGADQGDGLARLGLEADPLEDGAAGVVPAGHVLEFDLAPDRVELHRVRAGSRR